METTEQDRMRLKMKKDNVELGNQLEISLRSDAKIEMVATGGVPTYMRVDEVYQTYSDRIFIGFVNQIDEEKIGLASGKFKSSKETPDPGYVGGIVFHFDAIKSYKIKKKKR